MQLPAYWWLLALSIIFQGAFFVRFCVVRMRRKEVQPVARLVALMLYASSAAGLTYGIAQRDPLFFLGQLCLIMVYYRMQKTGHDEETNNK
ncbi:MAG: lipid-A-disaccharide synthase N-terminal domain-containing protein [Pseudodesulfovibrio sp.]